MTTEPQTRYVLYDPTDGVFLGCALGLAFWSKLDPVGQPGCPAFDTAEEARKCAAWLRKNSSRPHGTIKVVAVETLAASHATINECVEAGLPRWSDD